MPYIPKPIDTSKVVLSDELLELTERLAEHTHEVWSEQRLRDGWKWGQNRDDIARTHPCLVPYFQLPESEKEYDRRTAMGALKAITALGYVIARKPGL